MNLWLNSLYSTGWLRYFDVLHMYICPYQHIKINMLEKVEETHEVKLFTVIEVYVLEDMKDDTYNDACKVQFKDVDCILKGNLKKPL